MTSLVSRANDLIHFFGANPMLSANKKALAFASAFLNDVCLRQMMLASPMMLLRNDVYFAHFLQTLHHCERSELHH